MKKTKKNNCKKAIQKIKVYQLENKNQFLIDSDKVRYFQSYESLIAIYDKENRFLTLGKLWNYSNTTRKHLYIFINDYCYLYEIESKLKATNNKRKVIEKLIKEGVIKYDPELE